MSRNTGQTSRQILDAPRGAIFVWLNSHIDYPKQLARYLGRNDVEIISPMTLESWFGKRAHFVVDHAACLTTKQLDRIMVYRKESSDA